MKKFLTVLKFEYKGYSQSKSFIITTIILVAVILIASFIPQIVNLFSGFMGGTEHGDKAAYILTTQAKEEHVDKMIDPKLLDTYLPDYKWTELDESTSPEEQISDGKYDIVLYYDGGAEYTLYTKGSDMGAGKNIPVLNEMLTQSLRQLDLSGYPVDVQTAYTDLMKIQVTGTEAPVGGDASNNYWYAYILQFVLYMVMMIYGQFIMTSVVTEKSSKAMELLITSAKPMDLMFGKVIGVGLVALSQVLLLLASLGVGINLNIAAWKEFMPVIFEVLKTMDMSFGMIGYFILFFLIGFFTYAFLFAAFGSTVSKPEEASTVNTIPVMILVIAFILSIVSLNNMDAAVFSILSYVPLFSPFIMFNRICMDMATPLQIWISIGISVAGLIFIGWIAAKIYRVGIMIYGNRMNLKNIIQVIGSRNGEKR